MQVNVSHDGCYESVHVVDGCDLIVVLEQEEVGWQRKGDDITLAGIAYLIKEGDIWLNRMTIYPNLCSRSYELPRGIWKITRTTG